MAQCILCTMQGGHRLQGQKTARSLHGAMRSGSSSCGHIAATTQSMHGIIIERGGCPQWQNSVCFPHGASRTGGSCGPGAHCNSTGCPLYGTMARQCVLSAWCKENRQPKESMLPAWRNKEQRLLSPTVHKGMTK
eukprot:1156905-Pelagomonas_calceolata.AAC.2